MPLPCHGQCHEPQQFREYEEKRKRYLITVWGRGGDRDCLTPPHSLPKLLVLPGAKDKGLSLLEIKAEKLCLWAATAEATVCSSKEQCGFPRSASALEGRSSRQPPELRRDISGQNLRGEAARQNSLFTARLEEPTFQSKDTVQVAKERPKQTSKAQLIP